LVDLCGATVVLTGGRFVGTAGSAARATRKATAGASAMEKNRSKGGEGGDEDRAGQRGLPVITGPTHEKRGC
jgi:hypothetical protein